MRDIKFRGKRFANNEWIEGFLYKYIDNYEKEHYDILDDKDKIIVNHLGSTIPAFIEVKKESLGQFTGLHDKNGKEIYEGDIVKKTIYNSATKQAITSSIGDIRFKDGFFGVIHGFDKCLMPFCNFYSTEFEVIGNIYDNPELLKTEVDNIE